MTSAFFYSLFIIYSLFLVAGAAQKNICHFESIYQLGDSLSDTGNLVRVAIVGAAFPAARPPYGETFSVIPTGRWSDGRLIIDYIAKALQLPLLNPYREGNGSFDNGVNFAVAGATALNTSFFSARALLTLNIVSSPLSDQLKSFQTYLNSICHTPIECAARLRRALVLVGQIGAGDIVYASVQGRSTQEIRTYVPHIVDTITNVVRGVIRLGARQILVPGSIPVGCFPIHLTLRPSAHPNAYDEIGCLRSFNELAVMLNNNLQEALESLRKEFPNVTIIYSDYYAAFQTVLRQHTDFEQRLAACCGIGGIYNFNLLRFCGTPGTPVCPNPTQYMNWDGIHFTQEAYRRVSEIIIPQDLSKFQCV